jgi:hypothetical protein
LPILELTESTKPFTLNSTHTIQHEELKGSALSYAQRAYKEQVHYEDPNQSLIFL